MSASADKRLNGDMMNRNCPNNVRMSDLMHLSDRICKMESGEYIAFSTLKQYGKNGIQYIVDEARVVGGSKHKDG